MSKAGMLEVQSLTHHYGALPALRGVTFHARPGQILGYLGPNGSGKSTTVRVLVGLMPPSSGDVVWNGRSVFTDLVAYRRLVGYVPEEPHLYTHLTAPEYLQLLAGLRDLDSKAADRKIERFLELLGLADHRYATLATFSKGMRQKVLIAAALLHDPPLIVLDEPFSGLDVGAALMLRALIRQLAEQGRTILMSSHVIEAVEQLCTDVVVLSEGRVVAHDRVDRLRELQATASLEHVFVRLAIRQDVDAIAREFLEAVEA